MKWERNGRAFPESVRERAGRLLEEGVSAAAVARRLGVSEAWICRRLPGVRRRYRQREVAARDVCAVELVRAGATYSAAAAQLGCSINTVRRALLVDQRTRARRVGGLS